MTVWAPLVNGDSEGAFWASNGHSGVSRPRPWKSLRGPKEIKIIICNDFNYL
jgi:hypothetical protein